MKALLALAARHHVNKGQSFHEPVSPTSAQLVTADRHALAFKHQAMEALSKSLADPKLSNQDTTVASIFLLVFLDLLESGSDGWNFHLEGAKNLIASTYPQSGCQAGVNQGPGQTLQEIRAFITKQIKVSVIAKAFKCVVFKSDSLVLIALKPLVPHSCGLNFYPILTPSSNRSVNFKKKSRVLSWGVLITF